MDLIERELMTAYWACRRALERMEQLKNRKAGAQFRATMSLERADYEALGNRLAEELGMDHVDE